MNCSIIDFPIRVPGKASQAAHSAGTSVCGSREANEAERGCHFGELMRLIFDSWRKMYKDVT